MILAIILLMCLAGTVLAIPVFSLARIAWFLVAHPAGTGSYLAKAFAIFLLTVPIAILLSLVLICFAARAAALWLAALYRQLRGQAPHAGLGEDEPADTDEITVHLIHGTFEPKAPWTLRGSDMRRTLEALDPSVKISRFAWTGGNSPAARTEAVHALANKLRNSPSQHHYLVAHSHGGNIVREMSHTCPDIAVKVRGVCLLSPPFIFRRPIQRSAGKFLRLHALGLAFTAMMPMAALVMVFGWPWLYLLPIAGVAFVADLVLSNHCSAAMALETNPKHEVVDFRDVQTYHAIGDEADSALRFASLLHEACFGVLSQLNAAATLAMRWFHRPYLLSYAVFACIFAYGTIFRGDWRYWMLISGSGFIAVFMVHMVRLFRPYKEEPAALFMAAIPIAALSFWLSIAKALAYGDWRLVFCPNIFVSSSETPAGDHNVLKFAPQSDGMLMHSTHSHPEAIQNVGAWLASRIQE